MPRDCAFYAPIQFFVIQSRAVLAARASYSVMTTAAERAMTCQRVTTGAHHRRICGHMTQMLATLGALQGIRQAGLALQSATPAQRQGYDALRVWIDALLRICTPAGAE